MYPHLEHEGYGAFVMQQVEQLRLLKHQVDVLHFQGYRSKLEYFRTAIEVRKRTRSVKYDVVHAHYGLTGMAAVFRSATPLVITLHGSDVLIGGLQRMISRLACRFADATVAVSRQIAARVPGEIIPCGVDLNVFLPKGRADARKRLGLAIDKKYVLFPFNPSRTVKRFDLAAAAVNRLVAHGLNVELLTVSQVPNGDMPWYYSAADAMILSSDSEGSPTSVKEALACNLPVVTTDVGDVREIGEGIAGFQICAHTADSLADGLETVLHGGSGLAFDGRAAMRRYSLEQTALAIVQVYRRAMEARSSRHEKGCARAAGAGNKSGSPGLQ
jgi:glycosyltransferase involved in cell wall biosynthesis